MLVTFSLNFESHGRAAGGLHFVWDSRLASIGFVLHGPLDYKRIHCLKLIAINVNPARP